jgi:N-acetylglutamate synthase-like GNAT family acetyltransferase
MWVVELDRPERQVVGCVGVRPSSSDEVELKSLYIAAAARRRGLGEVLTGLVEEDARARGARRVTLWSDTRFADAHRLYARLGYRRLPGTRELHDLSGSREYPFAKDLAPLG